MNNQDIDKFFVSEYDRFLFSFDANHLPSASQLEESVKHKEIAFLRDNKHPEALDEDIWRDF